MMKKDSSGYHLQILSNLVNTCIFYCDRVYMLLSQDKLNCMLFIMKNKHVLQCIILYRMTVITQFPIPKLVVQEYLGSIHFIHERSV